MSNTTSLDPTIQAELAALRFVHEENDRYQRATSFFYRHAGWLSAIGFILIIATFVMLLAIYPDNHSGIEDGQWMLWTAMGMGWSGIITFLFSMARYNAQSSFAAIMRVLFVLTLFGAVAVPMILGFQYIFGF